MCPTFLGLDTDTITRERCLPWPKLTESPGLPAQGTTQPYCSKHELRTQTWAAQWPLYAYKDGTPLKPSDMTTLLQMALPRKAIQSHSLPIGVTTPAGSTFRNTG